MRQEDGRDAKISCGLSVLHLSFRSDTALGSNPSSHVFDSYRRRETRAPGGQAGGERSIAEHEHATWKRSPEHRGQIRKSKCSIACIGKREKQAEKMD